MTRPKSKSMPFVWAAMTARIEPWALGILLGGESRRMGVDKPLLTVGGETLVERGVRRLSKGAADVMLSVGAMQRVLPAGLSQYSQVLDRVGGEGPLLGVESLLAASRVPWVMIVPCDMPLVQAEHLQLLLGRQANARAAHFAFDQRPRPFPMLLHTDTLGLLTELIDSGARRLMDLLSTIDGVRVPISDSVADAVDFNLNTLADLDRWRAMEDGGLVDGP